MWGKITFAVLIVILSLIGAANAATIHGTVYDLELEPVDEALVEIDTTPNQVLVSQNGTYSFIVPEGRYELTAVTIENGSITASTSEAVVISDDGDYVIDLILFPDINGVSDLLERGDEIKIEEVDEKPNLLVWIAAPVLIALFLLAIYFFFRRKRKKEAAEEKAEKNEEGALAETEERKDIAEEVIKFIKEQEGRTTQKEIRKRFPYSEAKISLVVAELVHRGKIEKIKKGRSNIIVLK